MKLSYIFSLLPLVTANDSYLYEDRHHLRRALTAEGVGSCSYQSEAEAKTACEDVQCASDKICKASCGTWAPCQSWCTECVPNSNSPASNYYEMVETGDGWEDVDGDYILEEE